MTRTTDHAPPRPLRSEFASDPEMAEVLELFVRELPARVEAITSAWSAGDRATVRRLAHQLRGSGAGYGFPALTDAAGAAERVLMALGPTPDAGQLADAGAKVDALIDVCRRAASSASRR